MLAIVVGFALAVIVAAVVALAVDRQTARNVAIYASLLFLLMLVAALLVQAQLD